MFIQTEDTPNPATMKFAIGRLVVHDPVDIDAVEKSFISPLAQALFAIEGVERVFLGADFVSVTRKAVGPDWSVLRPALLMALLDHFEAERPVLSEQHSLLRSDPPIQNGDGDDNDVVARIRALLDLRIRPAVAQDGGDVAFEGFKDGVVYLRLRGACAGCPSATATLKFGIEQMLRHFVPEVKEVRRVM